MGKAKAGKYEARYHQIDGNPFEPNPRAFARQFKKITVDLTAGQAARADRLAIQATPEGYKFVECNRIGDAG